MFFLYATVEALLGKPHELEKVFTESLYEKIDYNWVVG